MDKKELLGKRIKELRKQKGFTQDELAECLKIEPRQLSKLETGKHYPSFETVIALLETFNITFEELLSFDHLDSNLNFKKLLIDDIERMPQEQSKIVYKLIRNIIN